MVAFEPLVERLRPDVIAVPGDVNGTMACALVGAKAGSLVAHIEAGLRSRDWSMPEEINRVVADRTSDFLFAPSQDAVDNLRAEGYRDDQIHLASNDLAIGLHVPIDDSSITHPEIGPERREARRRGHRRVRLEAAPGPSRPGRRPS